MGRTKKSYDNKSYCKRYRQKDPEKYRKDDADRKRYQRYLKKVNNPELYAELKKKNRDRMRLSRELKKRAAQEPAPDPEPESAFSSKQSKYRSLKRAEINLPNSPNKKMEVIGSLAKKYKLRNALSKKKGRKYEDLSEEQVEWLKDFLERSDMTYINPGKKDHVYIGKIDGVSQYVQKQYLLWTLRDTLDIINGNDEIRREKRNENSFQDMFGKKLSFARLYNFFKVHKQYVWNRDIAESSCLCEVCENACLLAKGVNKSLKLKLPTNPHDLVEKYSCGRESNCMNNQCKNCDVPHWECDESSDIGSDNDESDTSADSSSSEDESDKTITFYRWGKTGRTQKIQVTMDKDEAWETWCMVIKDLKGHIYRKRKQVEFYNDLKQNLKPNEAIIQVDYSEGYKNRNQDEIQSAYFGHETFSIFTACGYFRPNDTFDLEKVPLTIVSETNEHSRIASFTCVSKIIDCVEDRLPLRYTLKKVYLWSDGCSSKFRSRFTFALLPKLHPDKLIEWHYNEPSHGKGPMDGVGETIKNKVFREVKSLRIVVNSPRDFADHANRLCESVTTVYLPKSDFFEEPQEIGEAPYINGTLTIHKTIRKVNRILGILSSIVRRTTIFYPILQEGQRSRSLWS
ncbi:uncharacterized protein [Clytia hemisphaerica]|uniref:uncharacterized protein n=1 Tax=Clytia hemisphaerica TaxID=252671 RepID=UPI0034D5C52D